MRRSREKRSESAILKILSPVRLPFRHTGNRLFAILTRFLLTGKTVRLAVIGRMASTSQKSWMDASSRFAGCGRAICRVWRQWTRCGQSPQRPTGPDQCWNSAQGESLVRKPKCFAVLISKCRWKTPRSQVSLSGQRAGVFIRSYLRPGIPIIAADKPGSGHAPARPDRFSRCRSRRSRGPRAVRAARWPRRETCAPRTPASGWPARACDANRS